MKVAIVQERVDTRRGGAETSTLEMARHLAALGLDVTVVCSGSDEATLRPGSGKAPPQVGWPIPSGVGDANSGDADVTKRDRSSKLKLHPIAAGGGSRVARTIRFVAEADRFCREEGFDVVHAVTPCFACNVYQPRGGTYVETVSRSVARGRSPLGRLVKRIGRRFNRRQRFLLLVERAVLTDREPPFVAAVSEYAARQVRTGFPNYPADRLRVVFNGVDTQPLSAKDAGARRVAVRREIGVDERTPLVLFVAHNYKLKGLAELLRTMAVGSPARPSPTFERAGHPGSEPAAGPKNDEATKSWSRETTSRLSSGQAPPRSRDGVGGAGWVLVVVGRADPARYRRTARRLGVAGRVHFLGSRDEVRSLYAAADVLAHPTWYDPCSRVVLEALSCGLPVVTTRVNGAAEVIEDGRHGVVIDSPRDTAALAAAIATCLRPKLREACESEAAKMRERLSMARHARELKMLYEEVVAAKARMTP